MKIKEGYILRQVGGQHIVVPIGEASESFRGMIKLNETSAKIFELLQTGLSVDNIVCKMMDIYEVEEEVIKKDVMHIIDVLNDIGAIES